MYRQLLPLFFFLFSFVAAHAQQTERLIDNNPNYFYRGDQRPGGITAPADSNYMLVSYYQIAPNGVSQFGTLGTPVWIHRDSLISRGFFDGISGGGGSPFRTFYKELDFGEDYTLDIDTLDYYDQLIFHAKPLASDSTFVTFPDIDDTDQYKGKLISIYSDGGELNGLTIVDAAGNSVVNQVDCRFVGRYRFADTLRSERNGPVFANYRTDFEDDYTRVCEYVTEFSELNDTTDYTKTPGRIVYFGGNDEFWYINQNGYWSNHNDKIEQIAGDSAAAAQSRAEAYADGLSFSAGSFESKDTTVTTDFTVTVANIYTVTSFCDDGADNTIFLPTPVDSLKGNVIEVAHLDTSAAQSRTTTVETDGTSYHIYDNFTGDTLTSFSIYTSGQTVRFTLKEIEGVLRWVAVDLSPVVFGDKELTAVGKIRQGSDGDLYTYDASVSGERKVQYQYTVDSVQEILGMKLELADRVKVKGTGAEYLVQSNAVTGYTTDSVAVMPTNGVFAVLQPVGNTINTQIFGIEGDGVTDNHESLQDLFDFAVVNQYSVEILKGIFIISREINIPNPTKGMEIKGPGTIKFIDGGAVDGFGAIFRILNAKELTISGLTLDGNRQNRTPAEVAAHTIKLETNSENVNIENIVIKNSVTDGIYIASAEPSDTATFPRNINIQNIQIDSSYRNGISVINAINCVIQNNEIKNTFGTLPEAGIDVESDKGNAATRGVFILNNWIHNNNGDGILIAQPESPRTINIENNTIENNLLAGIEAYGSNMNINNNSIANCGEGITVGQLSGPDLLVNIENNDIRNVTTNGINATVRKLILTGNLIKETGEDAILTGNSAFQQDVLISNNFIQNAGSEGVRVQDATRVFINENTIDSTVSRGVYVTGGELENINTYFNNVKKTGDFAFFVEIAPSIDTTILNVKGNNITDFLDFGYRISAGGTLPTVISFEDNIIKNPKSIRQTEGLVRMTEPGVIVKRFNGNKIVNPGDSGDRAFSIFSSRPIGEIKNNEAIEAFFDGVGQSGKGYNVTNSEIKLKGTLYFPEYGQNNKSATDLSKTASGYLSEYATDGTLLESALTVADFDTLQKLTGWAQYTDGQYTSGSPLNVAAGDTATLFNNAASTITSDLPIGTDSLWNRTDSTIIGKYVGDAYTIRIDFTAESSSNDGYFDLGIDIGGTQNFILQDTYLFPKGQNAPHKYSVTHSIYTLDTFIANGGKIKIIGGVGTTEIYDVNFVITRTHASPD